MPGKRSWRTLAVAGALLLFLGACGSNTDSGGDSGGRAITVVATDFQFDTTTLNLTPGETVNLTFQNDGESQHTFTSDDIEGADLSADPGNTASGTFTAPTAAGSYEFHCRIHPTQMTGEIVVGGGGDAGSTDTTEGSTDTTEDTGEGAGENDNGY
jgi:plastocyanin